MLALRDFAALMSEKRVLRLGASGSVCLAMAMLELLIVIKFGLQIPDWAHKSMPPTIVLCWSAALLLGSAAWLYQYLARRRPTREDDSADSSNSANSSARSSQEAAVSGRKRSASKARAE